MLRIFMCVCLKLSTYTEDLLLSWSREEKIIVTYMLIIHNVPGLWIISLNAHNDTTGRYDDYFHADENMEVPKN